MFPALPRDSRPSPRHKGWISLLHVTTVVVFCFHLFTSLSHSLQGAHVFHYSTIPFCI